MSRGAFTTSFTWMDGEDEIESDIRVLYSRYKGFAGDRIDPPEPSSVEIIEITPADPTVQIPESLYHDEDLMGECLQDWAEDEAEAAEWRAQNRRDALLMSGFED